MALLSILVPTHNRRDYLQLCLDSLLPTTVPCEILVSDNASTDATPELAARYDDPRLRWFRQETNLGAYGNYNFLLAHANGDYLCLFGDDDIALPGCFERKIAILEADAGLGGIYSAMRSMDGDGLIVPTRPPYGLVEFSHLHGRDAAQHLLLNCGISWQSLVFRRELARQLGPLADTNAFRLAFDWDYLYRLSRLAPLAYLHEPTVAVRFHAGSGGNKAAVESGAFAEDMLHFWRKHLVEDPAPPVIGLPTWQLMWRLLKSAVDECYPADASERMASFVDRFNALGLAYEAAMEQRFAEATRDLDGTIERDVAGLPVFRPGLPPLEGFASKRLRFLHHADWHRETWRQVLRHYLQAFSGDDPVELILCGDPGPDRDPQTIAGNLAAEMAAASDPDRAAAVTLLIEPLPMATLAGLYATAHIVVPAGDATQLRRATQMDKVVLTVDDPALWRKAADRFRIGG
jgi:glycosyltransferase involved in cell wall biosynthesis